MHQEFQPSMERQLGGSWPGRKLSHIWGIMEIVKESYYGGKGHCGLQDVLMLEHTVLSIDDKLLVLSLYCAFELAMKRSTLEHVNHVVEINEGVIDSNNIHFARVKSSLGRQAPNMAKSIESDLHHHVLGLRLTLNRKTWLSVEQESCQHQMG